MVVLCLWRCRRLLLRDRHPAHQKKGPVELSRALQWRGYLGRRQNPINKEHIKEFGGLHASEDGSVPGTVWGASLGTSRTSRPDFWGHVPGWLRSKNGGVPPNIFLFIGFFFFPSIVASLGKVWGLSRCCAIGSIEIAAPIALLGAVTGYYDI